MPRQPSQFFIDIKLKVQRDALNAAMVLSSDYNDIGQIFTSALEWLLRFNSGSVQTVSVKR